VLLERNQFHLAGQLSGDIGLRGWLRSHADLVEAVPVGAHPLDVDTLDDLAALERP
jgi:CTP:molybdopterin cytidylyltransferase MocA